MRLRHPDDSARIGVNENQFGIRQLMIVTGIVAVVLGITRVVVGNLTLSQANLGVPILIIGFVTVAGVVTTLPLILAVPLPRSALAATVAVLLFIVGATILELPLLRILLGSATPGPQIWHFILINVVQTAWMLGFLGFLRTCGYRLAGRA